MQVWGLSLHTCTCLFQHAPLQQDCIIPPNSFLQPLDRPSIPVLGEQCQCPTTCCEPTASCQEHHRAPKKNKYKKKSPHLQQNFKPEHPGRGRKLGASRSPGLFPTGSWGGATAAEGTCRNGEKDLGEKRRKARVAQSTMRHHLKAKGLRRTLVPQWTSPERTW